MLRSCRRADADGICAIYNHYVLHSVATFEERPVSAAVMLGRIEEVTARYPWLVWEEDGDLCGYAYAAPWKERSAYRYSVETTVYVAPESCGQGIGSRLYGALVARLPSHEVHCAVGGISLPNEASVVLHERLGFRKIGHFREVGFKLGRWVDVGYWQLLL